MVIVIYSPEACKSITANLGCPEYSYYFVFKAFRGVLGRLGYVTETSKPENEVDAIYEKCLSMGEPCVFLSFSPPHQAVTGLKCPTASVFAWEFATIPTEPFAADQRNDWRNVLCQHGCAITLSSFAVRAVRKAMGSEFPVWSIPAPVWDDYVKLWKKDTAPVHSNGVDLTFEGHLIDFNRCEVLSVPEEDRKGFIEQRSLPKNDESVHVHLRGIIYTTVFNPLDGRKNWQDLISAFVWAFRGSEDVTLVLKVIFHDFETVRGVVTDEVFKLLPFKCRVVILHGYLDETEYAKLIRESTYVVNTSHGEGQCLPLAEYMSAGKPAISPAHSAMEDYINEQNSFVVRSSVERTFWPHDLRKAFRTTRYRIDWSSLYKAYLESYQVAKDDPARYLRMSRSAVESLKGYCSQALVKKRLKSILRERAIANADRSSARRKPWLMAARPIWKLWRFVLVPIIQSWSIATTIKGSPAYASAPNCFVWFKTGVAKSRRVADSNRAGLLQNGKVLPVPPVSEAASSPEPDASQRNPIVFE
jgi:glycosyltransferase involved in cell wall biosynthesis